MLEILTWSNAAICFWRALISVTSAGLSGPRLEAAEKPGSQPKSVLEAELTASDGRGWKYCGSGLPLASVNSWQSRLDPTTCPLQLTIEPLACLWKATWATPNMTTG